MVAADDLTVEYMEPDPAAAARAKRARKRKKRAKAKMHQDGAALGRALGMRAWGDGDPAWQSPAGVDPETDPETWWIYDLFARYGDEIRATRGPAVGGYDREDWLMKLIVKLVENPPTSLVAFPDNESYYRPTKTKQSFVNVAKSWAEGRAKYKTRLPRYVEGYIEIIDQYLAPETGTRSARSVLHDGELLVDLVMSAPEAQRNAVEEIIVGAAGELVRLENPVRQPDNIWPWLLTVLKNARVDALRAEQGHREILARTILDLTHWTTILHNGESAEAAYLRREAQREILGRIMRLPRHLGQVAYLRYLGCPNREIAWLLSIHRNTVGKRLAEIRSPAIRQALGLQGAS